MAPARWLYGIRTQPYVQRVAGGAAGARLGAFVTLL
jgi:hypothetical protein